MVLILERSVRSSDESLCGKAAEDGEA